MKVETIERIYELSPLQEGILFHMQHSLSSEMYFEQFSFTLTGALDLTSLERAWRALVDRHAVLRTSFHWNELEKPVQLVHSQVKLPIDHQDWRHLSSDTQQVQLKAYLKSDRKRGFDLSWAPLMRLAMIRLSPASLQFVISFHHVLLDGWSLAVVFREASAIYQAYCLGQEPRLDPPRPFEDYIAWLQDQDFAGAEAFWRHTLEGYKGPTAISVDRAPGEMPAAEDEYASQRLGLSSETTAALQSLARAQQLTLNTLIQGAWALLLSRYSSVEDVVFGAAVSGRPTALTGVESMVGLFINTLPVRVQVDPEAPLLPWLKKLQRQQFEAREFEHSPLVDVQGWSEVPRGTSLFETLVGFENYPVVDTSQDGNDAIKLGDVFERTNYPLSLIVWPGSELILILMYIVPRFDAASITRMLGHLQTLLHTIAANPDRRLGELPLATEAERRQLLVEWNQTSAEYPTEVYVHRLFEEWVGKTPDALAVACDHDRLSYAQLNNLANRVAHCLRRRKVGAGSAVAICLDRSSVMVAAILGVLKSGAAYVPLDPAYPKAHLEFMLRDSRALSLLTSRDVAARIAVDDCDVLLMDAEEIASAPGENPVPTSGSDDLAYIIYTSGSTGRPHGVEVRHRSLMNLVTWHQREYEVDSKDRATQVAGPAFDASVWELWPYITAGASVHVIADETRNSPSALIDYFVAQGITLSFLPTALAETVLDASWPEDLRLRALLTGGDRLHRAPRYTLPFRVVNHYGPTENTVVATWCVVKPGSDTTPPIGRPINNVRVYVLDSYMNPSPVGVAGELCIAGDSLAAAYRNLPELTARKFIVNPFSEQPGGRLYRTGDRVRYQADGNLEFLGRLDEQVKLRGYRIEPGEVERVLARHPAVRESVVVAREERPGDVRLVAYVVGRPTEGVETTDGAAGAWEREQLARWTQLYDDTYRQSPVDANPRFNIVGWNSSYTGQPLPAAEMQEQVDATVARILALRPQRILEIGCGTGLLLFRLAPHCRSYWATDFSPAAVDYVKTQLGDLHTVTVLQAAADDFSAIEEGAFDVVVLNSVVQYFPGHAYLERVLRGAVAAVRPGGHVFVGDIRSLESWEQFHASVQVMRAPANARREEARDEVRRWLRQEPELVVSPELFAGLPGQIAGITAVELQLKRGHGSNELTLFRYDAVLEVGGSAIPVHIGEERGWKEIGTLSALRTVLEEQRSEALVVRDIPNARLTEAIAASAWLRGDDSPATVGAWRELWTRTPVDGIKPEQVWALAHDLGYEAHVGWAGPGAADRFDVLVRPRRAGASCLAAGWQRKGRAKRPLSELTNDPLRSEAARHLEPALREYLHQWLPDYMVPSAIVSLESLPLTPNGKVDRRNLPAPETIRPALDATCTDPSTPTEKVVAEIFREVLRADRVGVEDNFFELGGHSLLATQIVSRVAETLQTVVPLRTLFEAPTVAGLARRILDDSDARPRIERIAQVVLDLSELSEDEIDVRLADHSARNEDSYR